jgi:hypothetical protein
MLSVFLPKGAKASKAWSHFISYRPVWFTAIENYYGESLRSLRKLR